MNISVVIWYGVLLSMTLAFVMVLIGARAAKRHDVHQHARWMTLACTVVGLWLVCYVSKQLIFGRDQFGGTSKEYWYYYIPILLVHTTFAITTIGLGLSNLYSGLFQLRNGTGVGALVPGVHRHRVLGRLLIGAFSGTITTAYLVYLMLFQWFPAS